MDVAYSAADRVIAYDLDAFAALSPAERRPFFEEAAARRGFPIEIIEKDFWVVWTLHVLFGSPDKAQYAFKGGTSLSKAFGLIQRFSEDIDLVIDRAYFGFAGKVDIAAAESNAERDRRRKELDLKTAKYVRERFVPLLAAAAVNVGVKVEIDNSDRLSVLVAYPSVKPEHPYVQPIVKIETGARADSWPTVKAQICTLVAETFPDAFDHDSVTVRTIEAHRTFLEKLTILHKTAHALEDDGNAIVAIRYSRHYYDVYCMHTAGISVDCELLVAVREAAIVFFPQGKAKYEEFEIGKIRILPSEAGLNELAKDYAAMRDMLFGDPPTFEQIVTALQDLQQLINQKP